MNASEGPGDPEDVGSLAEETSKLLGVLGTWAREQGGDLGEGAADLAGQAAAAARGAGDRPAPGPDHHADAGVDGGSPECRWCPACRAARAARDPDVREQLGVAATALLRAGTGILAAWSAETAASGGSGVAGGPATRRPVERIDLDQPEPDEHGHREHDDQHDDEDGAPDRGPGGAR